MKPLNSEQILDKDRGSHYPLKVIDFVFATFFIIAIFWMPIYFYVSGISVSGYLEENVGYRYLYSLRLAFGHENAWLPQGQLVTLFHALLQHILTLFNLPNNQLFPRVDIFSFWAVLMPAIFAWLACIKLSRQFNNKNLFFIIIAIFIFMMLSPALPWPGGASWATMPDYHVWVIVLAIFSASMLPPQTERQENQKKMRWFFWMGILTGIAGGIKITFMLFPLCVLAIWSLKEWTWQNTPKFLLVSAITSLLTLSFILWASTGFAGPSMLRAFSTQSIYFAKTQQATLNGADLPTHFESYLPLLLAIFLVFVGVLRRSWLLFLPGVTGLIYTAFVCLRFYSHSFIEYHAFTLILILPLVSGYIRPLIQKFHQNHPLKSLLPIAGVGLISFNIYQTWPDISQASANFRATNIAAKKFHQCLAAGPSPIWILTTENTYRPNSIESALCKGGMNIFAPFWGVSPYVASLFPNFHCAVISDGISENNKKIVSSVGTIGFSHLKSESLIQAIKRIEHYFGMSLANSKCYDIPGNYEAPLSYCYPKEFAIMES